VEYENETTKIPCNLFACVAHVYASTICSYVIIVDNREISVKKRWPTRRGKVDDRFIKIYIIGAIKNVFRDSHKHLLDLSNWMLDFDPLSSVLVNYDC
jgi:hypothetical protein